MTIRLVIADDHPLVLSGLVNIFQFEKDFELVASCTNGADALEAVRRYQPDVAVLDIRMPGKDGLVIMRELLAENLPTRFVFFTAEINEDQYREAIRLGIRGIVLKEMDPQHLLQCIRKVHAGEQWTEQHVARMSFEKLLRKEDGAIENVSLLTRREIDIIKMVVKGFSNKQIGEKLFISEGTVKVHLHNIFEKLQINSRISLVNFAQEKGLI